MNRLNQNVAGITLTAAQAKRDLYKTGAIVVPIPRKTKLTSRALINDQGAQQV